jgi:hypothetical protein
MIRAGLGHLQRSIITGFMSMAPTVALEVLLSLPTLHLINEAVAKASAFRLCGKRIFWPKDQTQNISPHKIGQNEMQND